MILIGIDTGVKTGFAYSVAGEIQDIATETILSAQERVLAVRKSAEVKGVPYVVCIEDVRLRKWVAPNIGSERLQGIGSVKRDCSIWQEFCERHNIRYILVPPAHIETKTKDAYFKSVTGYQGRTSGHGRDAGMMIYKYHRLITKGVVAIPNLPKDKGSKA
ncbi:hypothetical protein PSAR109036_01915 [Psychrobacter arenosus]|uniref:hypothetical protein n=1 Tax=Psychrobacter arenosus TaxID=256326 RepID=UPI00191AC321|nr:hypothetical protein [Psychrobacter arenosus]